MELGRFLSILLGGYFTYYLIAFLTELMSMKPQIAGAETEDSAVHYEIEKPEENVMDIVIDKEDTATHRHGELSNLLSYSSNKIPGFDLGMEQLSEGIVVDQDVFNKLRML